MQYQALGVGLPYSTLSIKLPQDQVDRLAAFTQPKSSFLDSSRCQRQHTKRFGLINVALPDVQTGEENTYVARKEGSRDREFCAADLAGAPVV
jgi:hypothetical protein